MIEKLVVIDEIFLFKDNYFFIFIDDILKLRIIIKIELNKIIYLIKLLY